MTANLKLVEFPDKCGNVPAMLRQLADEIEADGNTASVVLVLSDEVGIDVRGFGQMDGMTAIATLNLGLAKLVNGTLAEMDE